ncbi:SDR family oxidoreductase [Rhodobacteraceae bacterium RKSG542]|uniref:SDR family oxidoreductase n=1 Tax=Pseudovibrio flavus TaxID=2529854 RepID=UPI0012BD4C72|nr:SDR family oxidoreductase [Pseudovibrio flavus]MTI18805.1 SDR family oxidoreductase [Pseudovibrio flavus]
MGTIVITGANRGIGLELARRYSRKGHSVLACVRSPEKAEALKELANVSVVALDVTDPASCQAAAKAAGPVDLLVCNAGVLIGRGLLDDDNYTVDSWATTMATNVAGPFNCTRAFLPNLKETKGKVAFISSSMGSSGLAKSGGVYSYRASKAAVTNLAVNLSLELTQYGIAIGAFDPGWVRTDMGGGTADLDVEESAVGLIERFEALSLETTGTFETYSGTRHPF